LRIEGLSAAVLLDELAPGEWFIHSPGAGAVGRYLTTLAQVRSLHGVALVGSREPIAELWGLGADHVFVREPGLARRVTELGLSAMRLGFDGSGGEVTDLLASTLEPGGEVVVYGAMTRQPPQLSIEQLVVRDIRLRGFWLHRWAQGAGEDYVQALLQELLTLGLRERVAAMHGLDEWRSAIMLAESGLARGRVLLRPTLG
jgi:NADPH:quinone reductase-like Zn-dependent oxidoreductase